jgi:hypothetical protein
VLAPRDEILRVITPVPALLSFYYGRTENEKVSNERNKEDRKPRITVKSSWLVFLWYLASYILV